MTFHEFYFLNYSVFTVKHCLVCLSVQLHIINEHHLINSSSLFIFSWSAFGYLVSIYLPKHLSFTGADILTVYNWPKGLLTYHT